MNYCPVGPRLPSYEFVPVQYEENVDWAGFALRMAPTLLLIGAWVFFMGRGMGGMGGGMGGMGGKAGAFNDGFRAPLLRSVPLNAHGGGM